MKVSNYVLQVQAAERAFAAYDLKAVAEKFSLSWEGGSIVFPFLDEQYFIDPVTGHMTDRQGGDAPFGVAMTAFDYLTNPYGPAVCSGMWCAHESLNAVRGGTLSGSLGISGSLAAPFAGKREHLKIICEKMGASPADKGDYACILPLMPQFTVLLRFWDADEDFPVQIQFLWDRLTPRYLHYETTFYAIGAIMDRLTLLLDKQ